jgi:hypothetical protein
MFCLLRAVRELWERKQEVNIHGLIKHIRNSFKDYATVSWFKPWIAAEIYNRFLPNGGTVIDPCCGWGGRFMGAMDKPIKYVGYDINKLNIDSHEKLRSFLGNRILLEPEFHVADSGITQFADGDLLFTSPPYDDTENDQGTAGLMHDHLIDDHLREKRSGQADELDGEGREQDIAPDGLVFQKLGGEPAEAEGLLLGGEAGDIVGFPGGGFLGDEDQLGRQ